MNELDKEGILYEIKGKLDIPIPSFWKANITLGKTTELEYYSKIIVGQTFCGRQKDRLKKRLISDFIKELKGMKDELGTDYFNPYIKKLKGELE